MIRTYAVGRVNTVVRRDNNAGAWIDITPTSPQTTDDTIWEDVMTDPNDPDKVIVVGAALTSPIPGPVLNASIQVSTDAGVTWTTPTGGWLDIGLGTWWLEVWYCNDSQTIWITGYNGNVIKSVDGGLTFESTAALVNGGLTPWTSAICAIDENTAVVLGSPTSGITQQDCFVWRTDDAGATWVIQNGGATLPAIISPSNPAGSPGNSNGIFISLDGITIVTGTGYGQSISIDGGTTFALMNEDFYRSGIHLTWYPTYVPQYYKHTGGVTWNVHTWDSAIPGSDFAITRCWDPPGVGIIPPSNLPILEGIRGAHFYSALEGYYTYHESGISYIMETPDGGATGTISLQDNTPFVTFNAVWTALEDTWPPQPTYYELSDCEGVLPPIYTTDDLEFWSPSPKIDMQEIILTPCCGGAVLKSKLIPDTFIDPADPTWQNGLTLDPPPIIIYTPTGDTEGQCYALTYGTSGFSTVQPPGYIEYPVDSEIQVLAALDCQAAALEDATCDCETTQPIIYPGNVVTLVDCVPVCWTITELNTTDPSLPDYIDPTTLTLEDVEVEYSFEDCTACDGPPPPPEVPCPRPVDPGYSTGLCDPQIVEDIYCAFSDMIYQQMMSERFAIAYCCPPNEQSLLIQKEKLDMLLRTSENPTPDICDPKCYSYEIEIDPLDSAVTTYTDCTETAQVVITPIGADPTTVSFCALDTSVPTTVVTHADDTTDTYILDRIDDCVPCGEFEVVLISNGPNSFSYINCDNQVVNQSFPGSLSEQTFIICGIFPQTITCGLESCKAFAVTLNGNC